jgi:hypothetical protein
MRVLPNATFTACRPRQPITVNHASKGAAAQRKHTSNSAGLTQNPSAIVWFKTALPVSIKLMVGRDSAKMPGWTLQIY